MHKIEMLVTDFMRKVGKTSLQLKDEFYLEATKGVDHYLRKMYEENPSRKFSIRMSSIGRPTCQQQMERDEVPALDNEWNFPIRMMYGAIIESLMVVIMRHAGVNIQEEQTHVKLPVTYVDKGNNEASMEIPGTLDVVIDGKVYDIKSASSHSFSEKFKSYESLKESDDFGYLDQLYGYSKASGYDPGGWIVVDKSCGDIKVIEVPDNFYPEMEASMAKISGNVAVLLNGNEFERKFQDEYERWGKERTGNKYLRPPCSYCKYRYECWAPLQHLPSAVSRAFEKPMRYYTKYVKTVFKQPQYKVAD